jgi:paraquat-inducible protein A
MSAPVRAIDLGLVACRTCGLLHRRPPPTRCPRCAEVLEQRIPRSTEYSLALLITGMVLYIPANVLPVMYARTLGSGQEATILAGVVSFWCDGAWDIALLIFTASIAVPATKFAALGWLVWSVRRNSRWSMAHRTRLYRLVEIIGYWSMLDVAVVALTATLVQFRTIATAEPRLGIVFFCAVVVVTMIAAMCFDPRLIWDARSADER